MSNSNDAASTPTREPEIVSLILEIKSSKRAVRIYLALGIVLIAAAIVFATLPRGTREDNAFHFILAFFAGMTGLISLCGAAAFHKTLKYSYLLYSDSAERTGPYGDERVMNYKNVATMNYTATNSHMAWLTSSSEFLVIEDERGLLFKIGHGRGRFIRPDEKTPLSRVADIVSEHIKSKLRKKLEERGTLRWTQSLVITRRGLERDGDDPIRWRDVAIRQLPGKIQVRWISERRSIATIGQGLPNFLPLLGLVVELGARDSLD